MDKWVGDKHFWVQHPWVWEFTRASNFCGRTTPAHRKQTPQRTQHNSHCHNMDIVPTPAEEEVSGTGAADRQTVGIIQTISYVPHDCALPCRTLFATLPPQWSLGTHLPLKLLAHTPGAGHHPKAFEQHLLCHRPFRKVLGLTDTART